MLKYQKEIIDCRFLFFQGNSASTIVCFLHLQYKESNVQKREFLRYQFKKLGGKICFYSKATLSVFLSDFAKVKSKDSSLALSPTILRGLLSNSLYVAVLPVTKASIDFLFHKQGSDFMFMPLYFLYDNSFVPAIYIKRLPQRFFYRNRVRKSLKLIFITLFSFMFQIVRKKHSIFSSLLLLLKNKKRANAN
jgi:hypothetical protein